MDQISGEQIDVILFYLPTGIISASSGVKTNPLLYYLNRITAITPLDFLPISRLRELKLTKLAVLLAPPGMAS